MQKYRLVVWAALATAAFGGATVRADVPVIPPTFTDPLTFTNEFFPFQPGAIKSFRGKDGGERTVVNHVFDDVTRTFAWNGGSVDTHQLREIEFEKGILAEVSYNFFAQADDGAVFYFGEVVFEYDETGAVVSNDGSWLVGGPTLPSDPVSTATALDPAVIMPWNPMVGEQFKPEDLPPIVDETVTVLSVNEKLKVEGGKFEDVMKVEETSSLDTDSELKWHVRGIGVAKEKGKGEKLELIASTLLPVDAP